MTEVTSVLTLPVICIKQVLEEPPRTPKKLSVINTINPNSSSLWGWFRPSPEDPVKVLSDQ